MKQIISILFIVLISFQAAAEKTAMIMNPAVPTAKNAGRTVILKEVMRITDEQGGYYFREPRHIKIAPDESIFLVDNDQFLRFDKNGRFVNNQFKKGEGPGEYVYMGTYQFGDGKIIMMIYQPPKTIETDMSGTLLKEAKFSANISALRAFGFDCGKYWYRSSDTDILIKANDGPIDMPVELTWTVPFGEIHKTRIVFVEKWTIKKITSGKRLAIAMSSLYPQNYVMDGNKSLFACYGREYAIRRVNLEQVKVSHTFGRKYAGVPYELEKSDEGRGSSQYMKTDFFGDVQKILLHDKTLWVLTSTVVKEKGVLVDVFTKEGKYIDCFYLPLPGVASVHDLKTKPITLYKDFLFTVESGEDENPEVVKYQVK